jgi:hypothetical protein
MTEECTKINYDLVTNFKSKRVKITVEEIDEKTYNKLSNNFTITKFRS